MIEPTPRHWRLRALREQASRFAVQKELDRQIAEEVRAWKLRGGVLHIVSVD